MGDLESLLTDDCKKRSTPVGAELMIPYDDALAVIALANGHEIAVLGFDSGEILGDGFQVLSYSNYDQDVPFDGSWGAYVTTMNALAEKWVKEHAFHGANCGYVVTSASQSEFVQLRKTR